MGWFGGGGGSDDMIDHQNDQIKKKYEYDKKNYEYLWGIDEHTGEQLYNADGTEQGTQWDNYYTSVKNLDLKKEADTETRTYQEETAQQNWEMGKSQQQYQWDQQDATFNKSKEHVDNQLIFNQVEYNDAVEREEAVLSEQFIEAAFQNQNLIADLYEATGSKGYDQVASKLGLLQQEEITESQKQKQLINLKQNTAGAKFGQADTQIDMMSKAGSAEFQEASAVQNLFVKESDNRFKKSTLLMDMDTQDRIAQQQNDLIRRETQNTYAKAAHERTEANLKSLQAQGRASLTQAGRSQGKAIQMVFAELGRQQAYIAETLIRGSGAAEARMKNTLANTATAKQKSKLNLQQIAENTGQNIEKTLLNLQEIDRDLKVSNAKGSLNLDKIRKQVYDNIESTTLDVKTLESNLKHAQTKTGLELKKIDWDIDNLGSRFTTDQDVLKATLDSAVEASALNIKDLKRDWKQADLNAEAMRMLDPSIGREELNLDFFKPAGVEGSDIELPKPRYEDPQEPKLPPAPIEGAMMDSNVGGMSVGGAAITGAMAGLGAAGMAASLGGATAGATASAIAGAAPWIGIGVGALTFLDAIL